MLRNLPIAVKFLLSLGLLATIALGIVTRAHLAPGDCKARVRVHLGVSPVDFTDGMVRHENYGQVFMATRFIVSPKNDFQSGREFLPSIGTNRYAPEHWEAGLPDPRFLLQK